MNNVRVLRVVNLLLAISLLLQAITGLLYERLYSFSDVVHPINAWVILLLTAIHLYYNRRWIMQQYFRRSSSKGTK